MEVEIIERSKRSINFILRGVSVAMANTLRRIMIAEVPVMAIDDVTIIQNTSPVKDDILAHRLGLIPLKTDLKGYVLPEKCSCQSEFGCNLCSVTLTLGIEATDFPKTVYSEEIKSENPDVVPVADNIPLSKLAIGQSIHLEAFAKLGQGKDHAKWQPVSACSYKYVPNLSIDNERCDLCSECVEICSKKVLKINKKKLIVVDNKKCTLCKDCEKACNKTPSAIKVEWLNDSFIFYLESTGALSAENVFLESIKILEDKTEEFASKLSGLS
jgi:DNA-directed RNA polymerase subunit D